MRVWHLHLFTSLAEIFEAASVSYSSSMGIPLSCENGDPKLGAPGSPFSQEIGDPLVKMGTPSAKQF